MTMNKDNRWSEEAWRKAEPTYQAILDLPFIKELAAGTLPRAAFDRYITQDSLYIKVYSQVLGEIASRLPDTAMSEAFLHFALDGVAVERALHESFVEASGAEMSPACRFYTSVLRSQTHAPVEVAAATILPCFWVYLKVGQAIAAQSSNDNPYSQWIATYSDPAFEASTAKAIEICDALAVATDERTRKAMTEIFAECTRLEWLFWHSAYVDLKWNV